MVHKSVWDENGRMPPSRIPRDDIRKEYILY
jgi:hypothetical protein